MLHQIKRIRFCFLAFLLVLFGVDPDLLGQQASPVKAVDDTMYENQQIDVEHSEHGKKSIDYRLMRPDEKAGPGPHPLVIFLHGSGERGSDNALQLAYLPRWMASDRHRREHPCYLLAVQCPADQWWSPHAEDERLAAVAGDSTPSMLALEQVLEKVIETELVDTNRIYLTGLSMGGYGTWHLAAKYPKRFAAVAPICGGGVVKNAPKFKGVPIWVIHGTDDQVVPETQSREMVDAIRSVGGFVRYSSLPGVGHDSWTDAYTRLGVIEWMFEQKLDSEPTFSPVPE
jgi:predicted peptidase